MKELPRNMRKPYTAKPLGLSDDAWYYVGPSSIDVFAQREGMNATPCRLTRKQLLRALEIMDNHKKR